MKKIIIDISYLNSSLLVVMNDGSKYFLNKDAENDSEISLSKFESILGEMPLSKLYNLKDQIEIKMQEFSYGREITTGFVNNELRRRKRPLNRKVNFPENKMVKASDLIEKQRGN